MKIPSVAPEYLDVLRDYAVGWAWGCLCMPVAMLTAANLHDHAAFVHWIALLKWSCRPQMVVSLCDPRG